MEGLLTTKDIAQRYQCSLQCARNYMRRMVHMENPLTVYESDLLAWEQSRMIVPAKSRNILNDKPLIVPRHR